MTTHAVLYYTHFVSEMVKAELGKLRRELHSNFALFAMGCCHERTTLDGLASTNVHVRSYHRDDLRALPYGRQLENVDWKTLRRNPDLAIMRFFRGNADFDYYWILEYDVRYTGNWGELFADLSEVQRGAFVRALGDPSAKSRLDALGKLRICERINEGSRSHSSVPAVHAPFERANASYRRAV